MADTNINSNSGSSSSEEPSEPKGKAYEFSKTRAGKLLSDPLAVKVTLNKLSDKVARKKIFEGFREQCSLMSRLVKRSISGEYPAPYRSVASIVTCAVYVLMPIDAVPDIAPLIGYLDDAAVFKFTYSFIEDDLSEFIDWEANQNNEGSS